LFRPEHFAEHCDAQHAGADGYEECHQEQVGSSGRRQNPEM
jgi:hypothetical protein